MGFLLPFVWQREIQILLPVNIYFLVSTTCGKGAHMFVSLTMVFITEVIPSFSSPQSQVCRKSGFDLAFQNVSGHLVTSSINPSAAQEFCLQ